MFPRLSMVIFSLALVAGCHRNANANAGARLIGRWEEVREFGRGNCTSLDCAEDVPPEHRATLEFTSTNYTHTFPSAGAPMTGTWSVTSASGNTLNLDMTLSLMGATMHADPQQIVIRDANTIEMRNAQSRHGGIYHRM